MSTPGWEPGQRPGPSPGPQCANTQSSRGPLERVLAPVHERHLHSTRRAAAPCREVRWGADIGQEEEERCGRPQAADGGLEEPQLRTWESTKVFFTSNISRMFLELFSVWIPLLLGSRTRLCVCQALNYGGSCRHLLRGWGRKGLCHGSGARQGTKAEGLLRTGHGPGRVLRSLHPTQGRAPLSWLNDLPPWRSPHQESRTQRPLLGWPHGHWAAWGPHKAQGWVTGAWG